MDERAVYWDSKVKPLAEKIIELTTVDERAIGFFVSGMIWSVEHDLADGRFLGLKSLTALAQVKAVFNSDTYFDDVHPGTPEGEVNRMKELSSEIGNLLEVKE